jgi:Ca2+-transporting ATPase
VSVALQVAVVHVPLLNDAFDTSPLSLGQWASCAALASAVLWADELRKLARRRRRPARPGRGDAAPSPEGRFGGGT